MQNEKFINKYRIDSIRFKNWDYRSNAIYFITICVKNMECILGKIMNGKMISSEEGAIVNYYWKEMNNYFNDITLDEYIVMPNHFHAIIEINNNNKYYNFKNKDNDLLKEERKKEKQMSEISPKKGSLSCVIRTFKSLCTRRINKLDKNNGFKWQERYYDRLIRDEKALNNIRNYIQFNPFNWDKDRNNLNKNKKK